VNDSYEEAVRSSLKFASFLIHARAGLQRTRRECVFP
jgi:hypothetical protein